MILFYLGLGFAMWTRNAWLWRVLGLWSVMGLWLALSPIRPQTLEAQVLAVDHGLAVIHQAPNGHAIVYDCGKMHDPGVGRRIIAPALWARRIRRLDAIILSHADADHYNGLSDLLERFRIDQVIIPPHFATPANPLAGLLLDQVRARGIPIVEKVEGDRWTWSGANLTVHHPPGDWTASIPDNARSLVVEVESQGHRALWTGDLDGPGLTTFLGHVEPEPDVVLSPHHGGRTANPDWFYERLKPGRIVVSQRRPQPGTTDALTKVERRGFPLARTWERGALTLRWGPDGIRTRAFFDKSDFHTFSSENLSMTWLIAVGGLLSGTLVFAVMVIIEWSAWTLIAPSRKLTPRPIEPAPWQPCQLTRDDGITLFGALLKQDPSSGRLLVILHGFAEDRTAMGSRAEKMAERGWDVLVYDSRAKGRSGGEFASFGGREVADLRAWLDQLLPTDKQVVIWGRSMGAAVALQAASQDTRIAALVLEAPYMSLKAAVGSMLAMTWLPRVLAGPILRRASRLAGVPIGVPSSIDLAPMVKIPIMIVHGGRDQLIPTAEASKLALAFPQPAIFIDVAKAQHTDVAEVAGIPLFDQIHLFFAQSMRLRVDVDVNSPGERSTLTQEGFDRTLPSRSTPHL